MKVVHEISSDWDFNVSYECNLNKEEVTIFHNWINKEVFEYNNYIFIPYWTRILINSCDGISSTQISTCYWLSFKWKHKTTYAWLYLDKDMNWFKKSEYIELFSRNEYPQAYFY